MQALPPLDESILTPMTRPILIHYTSLPIPEKPQPIPAPQQDCATEDQDLVTPQEPSTSTEE